LSWSAPGRPASKWSRDFRHINPHTAHILLVEAGPRVLSGFPEKLADFARRSLERMGVEVLLDTSIEAIDRNGVLAGGQRIEAANVIWCAGVEASPVARWLGVATGKGGRVRVALVNPHICGPSAELRSYVGISAKAGDLDLLEPRLTSSFGRSARGIGHAKF
jgi:glycine/D-amino acid oxidase-like deaminating enzyme